MKKIVIISAFIMLCLIAGMAKLAHMLLYNSDSPAWRMPIKLMGFGHLQVKVAPALRLATTPLGKFALNGRSWHLHNSTIETYTNNGALMIRCRPCTLNLPEWSDQPLMLSEIVLALNRQGNHISGQISATGNEQAERVFFTGQLEDSGLSIDWSLPRSEIAKLLELLNLPEMNKARVYGTIMAHGTLKLPQGKWNTEPKLEGFEVYGLGTEKLRYGNFTYICRNENGQSTIRRSGDKHSAWIRLSAMGHWLPRTVIATEDARFYEHPGYDIDELLLLLSNSDRSSHQGSSTLTQQLAKNLFTGADHSLKRKVRELLYAIEMERTLGKQRILTLYLNTVDWGPGLCGIGDASPAYFSIPPGQLAPSEAAWLAGILRNPHRAYEQEFIAGKAERNRLQWVLKQLPRKIRRQAQNKNTLNFARHAPLD